METKFPKGPWDRVGATVFALDETGTVNRFSFNVQGGFVCRQQGWEAAVRTSDEELEAIAALSAASPDLYRDLEEAIDETILWGADHPLRLKWKATLRKARGEQL